MSLHLATVAAIIGMSVATYACRGGGYWIFRQIRPTPLLRAILSYLPGTLFVSYVAPALGNGGPQTWVGAAATVAAMVLTRNVAASIFGGTAVAWAVWVFGHRL